MEIELKRTLKRKWGVDGRLLINRKPFCDTVEHPTRYMPPGKYEVTDINNPFRHGDGPMLSVNGEIIVGENACPGLVIHSAYAYHKLIDRLKKERKRGHAVWLTIE